MCRNKIALFDSSELNLACTLTTRNVRNSRTGFALMCNLSHEKRKNWIQGIKKKLVIHISVTKSTKCLRNDANKGFRIDEL